MQLVTRLYSPVMAVLFLISCARVQHVAQHLKPTDDPFIYYPCSCMRDVFNYLQTVDNFKTSLHLHASYSMLSLSQNLTTTF